MIRRRTGSRLAGALVLAAVTTLAAPPALSESEWLAVIADVVVSPVGRSETERLIDGGTIDTDGFTDMSLSIGAEIKTTVSRPGRLGAVLIPDDDVFDRLLTNEGIFAFPIEITVEVPAGESRIVVGDQVHTPISFPRYRVYFYNSSGTSASVYLFAYRKRCGE